MALSKRLKALQQVDHAQQEDISHYRLEELTVMQMSFWGQTPRAQVLGSMDGPELGSIHGEPLRSKSERCLTPCSSDLWNKW